MTRTGFSHEIEIDVPPARLFAFLSDLHNYVELHPLIESIESISASHELPDARFFRVVDRITVGPFGFRTTYTAALEEKSELEIIGHAWQSPGIVVRTHYQLEPIGGGTRLIETATIAAPRLLRRFVVSQASAAHAETLAKLKAHLE